MEIIPVNFGLKYRPAKLGVEYHLKDQPNAHFVHEIPLAFVTKYSDIDDVTDELFEKNAIYLNPRVVSHNQVRRLIDRLVKNLGQVDKENKQAAPAKPVFAAFQAFQEDTKPSNQERYAAPIIEEPQKPLPVETPPKAQEEAPISQREDDKESENALDQFLGDSARRFDDD